MNRFIILLLATLMLSTGESLHAKSTETPTSSNTLQIGITVNSDGTVSLTQSSGRTFTFTEGIPPYHDSFTDTVPMDFSYYQFYPEAGFSEFNCYFNPYIRDIPVGTVINEGIAIYDLDRNHLKDYDVVLLQLNSDTTLSSLGPSSGTLVPAFDPYHFNYNVTVGYLTGNITFDIIPTYGQSAISVTRPPSLAVGYNYFRIQVTSPDGRNQGVYTVTVKRQSNNATLEFLTLNNGDIPLPFDPTDGIRNYAVTVPDAVSSITVNAKPNHEFAQITEGTGSHTLPVGDTVLSVAVTAEDPDFTETYRITVHRKSANATLKSFTLHSGNTVISQSCDDTGNRDYYITVPHSAETVTLAFEATYSLATVSDSTFRTDVGDNPPVAVTVTAEEGNTETYRITVHRQSNDATLQSLILNNGEIPFEFDPAVFSYTVFVPSSVPGITVDAEPTNEFAKITAGTGYYSLAGGNNIFEIEVTSEDGTVETYVITAIHSSNDATLKSLTLNGGAVPFSFYSHILEYRVEVEDEVSDITVACEASHPEAAVLDTGARALNYGDNVFPVTVIAEDYKTDERTTLVYTVTVHRISNDATLKSLTAAPAELQPPFDPDITQYTASVPDSVSGIAMDVEVNYPLAACLISKGDDFGQPGIKQLNTGENVFGVSVYAENKKYCKTYWVRITREATPVTTGFYEAGTPAAVHVHTANGRLHVSSPAAERINVYSVTGMLLYGFDKPAGASTLPFTLHPSQVLIVKGSSGWAHKIVVNG